MISILKSQDLLFQLLENKTIFNQKVKSVPNGPPVARTKISYYKQGMYLIIPII